MAMRRKMLSLSDSDRAELERRVRSQTIPARSAKRARIVLLASEGCSGTEIAEIVGVSEPTVVQWRKRYEQFGLPGLEDLPRAGRPTKVDADKQHEVLARTLVPPRPELGITHWSSRLLAKQVRLHFTQVARIWRAWGIQPWLEKTFKFSTDPQLEAKVHDVIGLYLHPPEGAVVLCVDEKSQVQALERSQPIRSQAPGTPSPSWPRIAPAGCSSLWTFT